MMLEVKSKDLVEDNNRRSCYSDGVAAKSSKLSSVNRIFVIGIIPGCQENYKNIRTMHSGKMGEIGDLSSV